LRYDDHLEAFRDALVDAFRTAKALDQFAKATGQVRSLAASVGEGPLDTVAYDFLEYVRAKGEAALDRVLEVALERQPGNDQLVAFAQLVGATRLGGAAELLNTWTFDLLPLEEVWLAELSEPEKRLVIFLLCGAEPSVLTNIAERLRTSVRQPVSTNCRVYSLDPKIKPAAETLGQIARLRAGLTDNSIICTVHAHTASGDAIDQFLIELRASYPDVLPHRLVLLLSAPRDEPVSAPCVRLPAPEFKKSHLYVWVDRVTAGKGWPDDVLAEFKKRLHEDTGGADKPTTDEAYAALGDAIDLLRRNPSVAALRTRFNLPAVGTPHAPRN